MQIDGELSGGWVAGDLVDLWIEVTLNHALILESILTQGRRDADMWITSFTLSNYYVNIKSDWNLSIAK